MKKGVISVLLILMMSASLLTGCGKKKEAADPAGGGKTIGGGTIGTTISGSPALKTGSDSTAKKDKKSKEGAEIEYYLPEACTGSSVVSFNDYAFFIDQVQIIAMNTNTGTCTVIWHSGEEESEGMYYGANGTGLLLYNKLYFMHKDPHIVNSDFVTTYTLCSIDLETRKLDVNQIYEGSDYMVGNLYYKDHMLYVDGDGLKDVFRVNDEGEIVELITRTRDDSYRLMPKGYTTLCYSNNGSQTLFPAQTVDYGKRLVLVNGDYDTVVYDVNNGRETLIGGYVLSYYGENVLTYEYRNDEYIYGTLNITTGEYKFLGKYDEPLNVFAMDEKYVYHVKAVDGGDIIYYNKINIESGRDDSIYSLAREDSALNLDTWNYGNPVFDGKNIYTTYTNDYQVKIAALSLETGEATISDMVLYDSRIGEVGTLTRSYETVEADDGKTVCTTDIQLLQVDEKFGGASKINTEMTRLIDLTLDRAKRESQDALEWYNMAKEDDGYFAPYGFTYGVNKVSYFDNQYLSFLVDGYDFLGGAHGMPVKLGYTFDVNTGNKLHLKDLVNVSEEEVKDTGLKYFKRLMERSGGEDLYWENATDTIHERLGYSFDDFYLTDKGLCLYFAPYELASYAEGFQMVIVPYEELGIPIETKVTEDDEALATEEEAEGEEAADEEATEEAEAVEE